jgi:hypothetical protein
MVVKILVLHFIESSKETPRRLPWKNTAGHSMEIGDAKRPSVEEKQDVP